MKIAYRRMSGAIGLSSTERGARGLWWEKRKALVMKLHARGHEVLFVNRMTKESSEFPVAEFNDHEIGMLIVEFGSSNTNFYGIDLKETIQICNSFKGPKVFINDDPDLPFIWDALSSVKDWTCWHNASHSRPLGKQPREVPIFDMPFSVLQNFHNPRRIYETGALAYIGRPNGRAAVVKQLIAERAPWQVYGKQKEWDDFGVFVKEPPNQPERVDFYAGQIGCLVLADKKHKEMGWRTGRAYHAALAGCPALVEDSHTHLKAFPKFASVSDIVYLYKHWQDPELRAMHVYRIHEIIAWDRQIATATMVAHGL